MTHADDRLNGGAILCRAAKARLDAAEHAWEQYAHGTGNPETNYEHAARLHAHQAFLNVAEFIGGKEFREAANALLPEAHQ